MNTEVGHAIRDLMASLNEVNDARIKYHQAVATAREKSEELSTLLNTILKQPHIVIDDECELDG